MNEFFPFFKVFFCFENKQFDKMQKKFFLFVQKKNCSNGICQIKNRHFFYSTQHPSAVAALLSWPLCCSFVQDMEMNKAQPFSDQ
jgi:hypothetical protein